MNKVQLTTALTSSTLNDQLSPEVTRALAQMDVQEQEARAAGLWDDNYSRMHVELGNLFREANDVDSVLDVCFQGLVLSLAKEHGLRLTRAAEDASEQLDGKILIWRESGVVILPHDLAPLDALDQLRAAVGEVGSKRAGDSA